MMYNYINNNKNVFHYETYWHKKLFLFKSHGHGCFVSGSPRALVCTSGPPGDGKVEPHFVQNRTLRPFHHAIAVPSSTSDLGIRLKKKKYRIKATLLVTISVIVYLSPSTKKYTYFTIFFPFRLPIAFIDRFYPPLF